MSPRFEKLAILGFGLLGGSVALAARERGIAGQIAGASRSREPLEAALASGKLDEIGSIGEAVTGADLVVLAAPVSAMPAILGEAAPHLAKGVLVTDLGSVKSEPCRTLPGLLPEAAAFVGAHPMAGGHELGARHARADLFEGRCCVVTPLPETAGEAVAAVSAFWASLGCRVVQRSPEQHDVEVAWISHLPHVLAFAYSHALAEAPPGARELVGSGFQDFTRIARSDAELWAGILEANQASLGVPIERFSEALGELAKAISNSERGHQERFLARARAIIDGTEPRGSGENAGA